MMIEEIEKFNKLNESDLLELCKFITEKNDRIFSRLNVSRLWNLIISTIRNVYENDFPEICHVSYLKRNIINKYISIYKKAEGLKKLEFDCYSVLLGKNNKYLKDVPKEYLENITKIEERVRIKEIKNKFG